MSLSLLGKLTMKPETSHHKKLPQSICFNSLWSFLQKMIEEHTEGEEC